MLRIAVVAADFRDGIHYIDHKFKDKVAKVDRAKLTWTLDNGDEVHLCWGEPNTYRSMEYDAYVVTPDYIVTPTLEDIIRERSSRQ